MYRNILTDFLPSDYLFVQDSRSTALELVIPLLHFSLVGSNIVPHQRRLLRRDHTYVDVRTGPQIIEDTSLDGVRCQLYGLFSGHLLLPLCLKYRHRCQRSGTHRNVRELVRASVSVDGEESNPCRINTSNY